LIYRSYDELLDEGHEIRKPEVGVMIEVPAAAYQARLIADKVDFLAVGSNDLTQYMLAVDRNNPRVADLYQDLHPAVLGAIRWVVDSARAAGKPSGICGELAGNPAAAVLLMGMGFDVLSMNSTNLPKVKWVLRSFSRARAEQLATEALGMASAEAIIEFMHGVLVAEGLGRAIRPDPRVAA
jgi:phosphotransferase system enzyme I (PtsP)